MKYHIENEMQINLDLIDIFSNNEKEEISEVFTCPFNSLVVFKNTGLKIDSIKLKIDYCIDTISS